MGERLIIMAGTVQMEWHHTPGNHVFDVFDTIPMIPLQSLPQACSPQLRCHQPPVLHSNVVRNVLSCGLLMYPMTTNSPLKKFLPSILTFS